MKKIYLCLLASLALSLTILSCSSDHEDDGNTMKKVVYMIAPQKKVQLTEAQRVFVNDNNAFAFDFLKMANETEQKSKSFIYSPLSVTYVLGMVNDAATGKTEQELEQTLGFHEGGIQAVNEYCKTLIENLPKADEKVTLDIANAIFLNKNYQLKEQFQKDMQEYYKAKAEALDFSSPKTLDHINGWCKDKTRGMIPSILENVDPSVVSYLLNAIYFKADWAKKFDPKNTKTETFTTETGKQIKMPMMQMDADIAYLRNDTYSVISIPYGNGLWNMTIWLPEEGKAIDDVIALMAEDKTAFTNVEFTSSYLVNLKLPRFETATDTEEMPGGLTGLLKNMGINQAFNPGCKEIINMCSSPVYIDMMRQKAKINVNEEGTETSVVTVAAMATAAFPELSTFHANRPFIYAICERSSGVILSVGKFTGE